jgi:hypothetical protein
MQSAMEMVVASDIRGPEEQASVERRAREVAAHLAEDTDERQDHIFAAHKALVRAEAAL